MSQLKFGVMRRRITGVTPEQDECHFDGWYSIRLMAATLKDRWNKEFPDFMVSLISAEMDEP